MSKGRKELEGVKFGTIEVMNYAGPTDAVSGNGQHARWFCYCSECNITFIRKGTCIRRAQREKTYVLCPQCYKKGKEKPE